ncbi:MAG: hypothetical protein V1929_13620 [bacterium]
MNTSLAAEFDVKQLADPTVINRDPVISETGIAAWIAVTTNEGAAGLSDLVIYRDGSSRTLTQTSHKEFSGSTKPVIHSNSIAWVAGFTDTGSDISWVLKEVIKRDEPVPELTALYSANQDEGGNQWFEAMITGTNAAQTNTVEEVRRHPSGADEICLWQGEGEIRRITRDSRDDYAPSVWGNMVSWQIAKGWPFGWEIMLWDDGTMKQLTTNYYYDMAPKVYGSQVTWYGWDGHDFEIFLYDKSSETTLQITSNQYDDVSPVIAEGIIAWEGYPSAEADIFIWKDGQIRKISDNIEDDFGPRVYGGKVVWQGFDGDDFEIYFYDGEKTVKLTSNLYDDTNPDIGSDFVCWMGYVDNWDAEIFVSDTKGAPKQLTDNEDEDRDPHTAGHAVIWQVDHEGRSNIFLAEPKQ